MLYWSLYITKTLHDNWSVYNFDNYYMDTNFPIVLVNAKVNAVT